MKNGPNRRNKQKNDKIQKSGRAGATNRNKCGQPEARKGNLPKLHEGKKAGGKCGEEPCLKLKDVSTGL